ncbi:MAG: cytochrome c4 [Betaproteobacteria bacterium]|nr:cytochrome c4 [Betaproteobacteria bacterium]MDE2132220.1 cytochrome c4 [Betaproteobacteria bacterium]
MKSFSKIFVLTTLALAVGACSNIERSRNLANPQVSGSTLAQQVCASCHGGVAGQDNGTSINPSYPNLAGQQAVYLETELQEFRDHSRTDPAAKDMMWGLAASLTPAQMKQLAEFYAGQKPRSNPGRSDPALVAGGQKIFAEGNPAQGVPACATCHGSSAEGNGPIPRLAGQHADYLYKQLMVFNSDAGRETHSEALERPHGVAMDNISHSLSDAEKHQVADYLQSLR